MFITLTTFIERKPIYIDPIEIVCIYEAAEENSDPKKYIGATGIILRCAPNMAIYVREKPESIKYKLEK